METIIAATGNANKIKEMKAILNRFDMDVIPKDQVGLSDLEPEENGTTYEENSLIKAKAIMEASGKPCVADDSGLEVEYLDGAPGVHSARFAGDDQDYDRNNAKLLSLLEGVPYGDRKAKFVTVITIAFPDGRVLVARGECHGHILTEKAGDQGFGYDPLFIPDGYQRTFAQMGPEIKNKISHRAKALETMADMLEKMKEDGDLA